MGEPENQMHNYAFPPSVANWVHSTTLATQTEGSTDEPTESEPDAFYRPPQHRAGGPPDMTTSRLRQQTSNGAVPTATKPSLRSASSPVTSTLAPKKSTPNLPGNRPAVRSLVQKFNQPISPEQQTSLPRVRPSRPTPTARSTTSPEGAATTSSSSTSRPTPAYGPHKFPNLKQRERPQLAPPSPARVRRTNASRSSFDEQTASSRNKIASPTRTQKPQTIAGRQPFFGEVVGDQNGVLSPGYGIPSLEGTEPETADSNDVPLGSSSALKSPAEDTHLLPSMAYLKPATVRHKRSPSEMTQSSTGDGQGAVLRSSPRRDANRSSPPSRIPKPKRPTSTTSDSSTSTRSSINQALGNGRLHTSSPHSRRHIGKENSLHGQRRGVAQIPLQPISFLEYRERQKSPKGASNGASLTAVITATPPQTSPRLRNSRERQLLPHSDPRARSRSAERFVSGDLEEPDHSPVVEKESNLGHEQLDESPLSENASHCTSSFSLTEDNCSEETTDAEAHSHQRAPSMDQHDRLEQSQESATTRALEALSLDMSNLQGQPDKLESTPATEFEYTESPVLGMPGSFMMTPPIEQSTPKLGTVTSDEQNKQTQQPVTDAASQNGELLQARAFHPRSTGREPGADSEYDLPSAASEISVGETIPIMLGSDTHRMGWNGTAPPDASSHRVNAWRAEHLNASSGSLSYLDDVDSPIDPFGHRSSIRPEDSASVAFFRPSDDHDDHSPDQTPKLPQGRSEGSNLTLDSEAYSVINRVLDLYHQSTYVTPQMASQVQQQIQAVSPAVAQHKDWDSKDATTSYLTRVLSDANSSTVSEVRTLHTVSEHQPTRLPSLTLEDEDESGVEAAGTAIIFPSESRRYSRGSRGSTATTIWEDGSRADSASVNRSREQLSLGDMAPLRPTAFVPNPPPKDWRHSPSHDISYPAVDPPRSSYERLSQPFSSLLPEIETAGEGLGLSLQAQAQAAGAGAGGQQRSEHARDRPPPPPAPTYTPPPPPGLPSIEHAASQAMPAPYSPSVYTRQPPSSIHPAHPLPENNPEARMYSRQRDFAYPPPSPGEANDLGGASPLMPAPLHVATGAAVGKPPSTPNGEKAAPSAMGPPATVPSADATMDATTKALKKRLHIIKEILDTENAFSCDMVVIDKMFRYTCDELLDDKEERTLFGNSGELCDFAELFFSDLKKAVKPIGHYKQPLKAKTKSTSKAGKSHSAKSESEADTTEGGDHDGKSVKERKSADDASMTPQKATLEAFANLTVENDRKTRIGEVFMKHMQQIEKVFRTYLLNHENANEFLKTIIANERIQGWQKACIGHAEGLTQAWDLDSLLVKPTQRIMKYPLLLAELKAVTPTDHPDYPNIEAAHKEILDITMRINLEKKKMETLRAATKEGKKKQKGAGLLEVRLGKGFVKAFGRKTDKMKQHAGLSEVFDDPDYNYQSQRFGGHFFQLQIILRDVENYLEKLTICVMETNSLVMGFLNMLESNPTCPEIESQWRRNAMAFMELQNKALEEHKNGIQTLIIQKIVEVWKLYVGPQTLMEERKKGLIVYAKYKTVLSKGDKVDKKLQEQADRFMTINNTLKVELPKLYTKTKTFIGWCLQSLIHKQMEWWMKCQRKIYPLLEQEPSHTTVMSYDLKTYVDRFHSDFSSINAQVLRLGICNHSLLSDISHLTSPLQSYYSDDGSSRKSASASRRTHSLSSDVSVPDGIRRRSGGLAQRPTDGSHSLEAPPRSSPTARSFAATAASRAISPGSERSDMTVTQGRHPGPSFMGLDGAMDYSPTPSDNSFLSPTRAHMSRSSTVFSSALPMSDSPAPSPSRSSNPSLADQDEPEVLFLAASLFEFNIAHDRREGGIPYLVYVPGEIFDVIGMKGELWLARNQDDATRTVGWIWEKHFARILPEDA